jgi:small subunit ribosomal protein S5
MSEEQTTTAPVAETKPAAPAAPSTGAKRSFPPRGARPAGAGARKPGTGGPGGARGGDKRGGRSGSFERPKPEFEQKILAIRRVTRVVSGGRRMSFAVAIVIGDKKGSVGLGTGKAGDTALAINKAVRDARKNMIKIKMTKNGSLPFDIEAKYSSAHIIMAPNNGKGLVTGSAVRDILALSGIKDVTSKVLSGSKNKLNIGRATLKALSIVSTKKIPTQSSEERHAEAK